MQGSKIGLAVAAAILSCSISASRAAEEGGSGKGGHGGKETGGLKLKHGLGAEHAGHASGAHTEAESGKGAGQRFGGGSGIAGSEQISDGPENGASRGFGPESRSQFRFRGGWTLPEDDDGGGTTPPTDPGAGTGGSGGSGTAFHVIGEQRCEDMSGINASNRLEGKNLERFRSALSLLAPGASLNGSSALLLANFQTELARQAPDPVLAGTYLGMVAKVPVTTGLISKVSSGLCVIPPGENKSRIADVAEEQRRTGAVHATR